MFMLFILIGYFCGLSAKFLTHTYNLAFYFYFPNIALVMTDIILYFRNQRYESGMEKTHRTVAAATN